MHSYLHKSILFHSKPESGGYDLDFVDTIAYKKKYCCNICTKVLRDARLTVCCGQHYCDSCLKKWLEENNSCPHCRKRGFQSVLNKAMIPEIKEFKVRCTNKEKGCKWVGELGSLKHHLESDNGCDYVMVKCMISTKKNSIINNLLMTAIFGRCESTCGAVMKRCRLTHHQKNECIFRQYKCQYCAYVDTYDAIAGSGKMRNEISVIVPISVGNHYDRCTEYPQKCPNECGEKNIKRKDIVTHRKACLLKPLDCPFQHVGCSAGKILRKDLGSHCKKNIEAHLLLVVQSNQKLARKDEEIAHKNEELGRKHEELVHKNEELSRKHEELSRKHEEFSRKNEKLSNKHEELSRKNERLMN